MAQKKFSRLSVMLEAKDRMSKPILNAARASQNLQRKVKTLSGELNKSKNSTANAVNQTKILNEKYKELARSLGQNVESVKRFSAAFDKLPKPIKAAINNLRAFSKVMLDSVKNTKLYKTAADSLSNTLGKLKKSFNSTKEIAKQTSAYKTMAKAMNTVKTKARETALAFTLWKNSSKTVETLKNRLGSMGGILGKLKSSFSSLRKNVDSSSRSMNKFAGKRATFNQLADSNARLNKQLSKMNNELSRANGKLSKMKGSMGHISGLGTAFGLYYGAQELGGIGSGAVQGTIGTAMEQQYSQASVNILAGNKKGPDFYNAIQDYASTTSYSPEDWAANMRAGIKNSDNTKDLKKYMMVIEQLATLDPVQGIEGAALAVRELNSGDSQSLVERFELPRGIVNNIKNLKDPIEQVEKLSKIIGEQTGYSAKNIQKMKELPLMQWQKFTNLVKRAFGLMGSKALEKLAPIIEDINNAITAGDFDGFIDTVANGMASATQKIIDFSKSFNSMLKSDSFQEIKSSFSTLFSNISATLQEAWPTIKSIVENLGGILVKVADEINEKWPTINTLLQTAVDALGGLADWANDNGEELIGIIEGIAAGWATWKILTILTPLIGGFITAINLMRNGILLTTIAQAAWNIVMSANPIGVVIMLIAGLVGIIVTLYQNWDIVTERTIAFWNAIGGLEGAIRIIMGPIGILIGAAIDLARNWDNTRSVWENVWGAIQRSAAASVNATIGLINTLIGAINSIPGIKIPSISKVSWGSNSSAPAKSISKKNPSLGNLVNYAPKNYGGLKLPGHKGGLNKVPYDNYVARLHEGERVLTKQENKEYNGGYGNGKGVLITGNTFHVREDSDIDKIANALYAKLYETKQGMG